MINNFIRDLRYCFKAFRLYKGLYSEKFTVFFILFRLMLKKKLFQKKNSEVSDNFFGMKITAYDYFTLEFLFKEVFIADEYRFSTKKNNPIIIDCGANIGASVFYFKKLYPESKIIAFEANPHTFQLLEKNVKHNNFKNVELHNIALLDKEGEISFFISENIGTLVGSIREERGGAKQLHVKAERLSQYLHEIDKVDAVKIDIEGAEINVLNDLFESGAINKSDQYMVEYHHNINDEISGLSDFLKKFEISGFKYSMRTDFETLGEFQDILIHFYK